jgi:LPXTG-site transpeptidase (sortase) family protein
MTAITWAPRLPGWAVRRRPTADVHALDVPALGARLRLVRAVLVVVCIISTSLLLELTVVSSLQQRTAQQRLFDQFRGQLAQGTAPTGPTVDGRALALGAPVAHLEIPTIGLRQVVVEGTTSGTLFAGPGHRRDSPLPGQAGVSVIFGRRAAFGGPFARIHELEPGAVIRTTTGQGIFVYRIVGVRKEGDPLPPPAEPGQGQLVLATADGRPLLPNGVLRVDAELDGPARAAPSRPVSGRALPASEQSMKADTGQLWVLALWLEALVVAVVGAVWAWHRWGRAGAWAVFLPVLLLVGLHVSNQLARLLPNLL